MRLFMAAERPRTPIVLPEGIEPTPPFVRPVKLLLQVGNQRQSVLRLEVVSKIVIGRIDNLDSGDSPDVLKPDLNLSPYKARDHGVSRLHAALENRAGVPYVVDLKSTSGTRLNGLSLEPSQAYRLRDGDELELGSLRIVVKIVPGQ
jgi:pSer/pThr/pTyr-binding forkhead associated (FHA) protein